MKIEVLSDGTPRDLVNARDGDLLAALKISGVDIAKKTIQFVGFVTTNHESGYIFLPKGCDPANDEDAALTMAVLAKFARTEGSVKVGSDKYVTNGTLLSAIAGIADDYRKLGPILGRKMKPDLRNGHIDWASTFARSKITSHNDGTLSFDKLHRILPKRSDDNFLSTVQMLIVEEIARYHSWWLPFNLGLTSVPNRKNAPSDRKMWIQRLRLESQRTYSHRLRALIAHMLTYLEGEGGTQTGGFMFGISDFSTIWERMLRDMLRYTEKGWSKKLALYVAEFADGHSETQWKLVPDYILRHEDHVIVADAKYYLATSGDDIPGRGDIRKQNDYLMAVKEVSEPGLRFTNCFIFPKFDGDIEKIRRFSYHSRDGAISTIHAPIECVYYPTATIMRKWLDDGKINLFNKFT